MQRMHEAMAGAVVCGAVGALIGLGTGFWLLTEAMLFPGDTIVIGAVLGAIGGFIWGRDFLDFVSECWTWLL